ncbi:uncharacterized protein LOC133185848 [Saccostrea echinata]|uniref:uncharacterized protein LOC133185848 n=1 Tax=Saccostrea echinata TaxID=191078 RepID=UPI002A826227|nr:uncharacterized protein LOC133185848 [Saccostrea echinata]
MSFPESISDKLEAIKSELTDLRRQDVDLMKQLITISETIQKMNKSRFPPDNHVMSRTFITKINGKKGYIGVNIVPPEALSSPEAPLLRRQSAPTYSPYYMMNTSVSSVEDLYTSDDDFGAPINSVSDADHLPEKSTLLVPEKPYLSARRFSDIVTKYPNVLSSRDMTNDSEYEEILLRNIKLWKEGQIENDSVFV